MIHAISINQLQRAPRENFIPGHHYMLVDWTKEYCVERGFNEDDSQCVVKFLEKNPTQFKLVYESIPFRNTTHSSIAEPYLKLYILEKL